MESKGIIARTFFFGFNRQSIHKVKRLRSESIHFFFCVDAFFSKPSGAMSINWTLFSKVISFLCS